MGRRAARCNCPFCGWHCTDMQSVRTSYRRVVFWVECCSCRARGPEIDSTHNMGQGEATARRLAVDGWNKRAEFLDANGDPPPRVPLGEDLFR
jgi:hypothetical protein